MRNKCLYFHINPLKNEIFYVGIGSYRRPYIKSHRSSFWNNMVSKYGYIVDIVHSDLTSDEACELEIQYIKRIGRRDLGLGPLVNMTNGGDGTFGVTPWNKGKSGYKNKPCSEDRKAKISAANKGCVGNKGGLGSKRTSESKFRSKISRIYGKKFWDLI